MPKGIGYKKTKVVKPTKPKAFKRTVTRSEFKPLKMKRTVTRKFHTGTPPKKGK